MSGEFLVLVESHRKEPPYVQALLAVGVPAEKILVLTPGDEPSGVRQLAASAAGLLLCGGPDVEPWRYGEEPLEGAELALDPALDRLEWKALAGAQEASTPVWAVCRGMQVVNVFLGGTLWQDLPLQFHRPEAHHIGEPLDHLAHDVTASAEGRRTAFGALFSEPTEVNTRHHQAVRELSPELQPLAHAPDGVLEVLHRPGDAWWVRAVQWHPENLIGLPLQRRLFADFVQTALTADR